MEGEGGVGARLRVRVRTRTIRRNELLALPPLTQGKLLVRAICNAGELGWLPWVYCATFTFGKLLSRDTR